VFVLPGNHDTNNDEFTNYMSFFGDDYYTVNLGFDIFLIMANAHKGELNSTQIGWIERDFRDSNAEIKILGIHYSLTNLLYYNEIAAHELIRICSENNVDIVLTGHAHSDRVDNENGTLWIQTTSLGITPTSGGHGRYGFRVIEFQENILTSWNWTKDQPWSQPWDSVKLTRYPKRAHEIDVGAYLSITNNLNYSIDEQVLDFLVEPITGNQHYIATGAKVLSTVNGTEAYLVRVGFDLDTGQSIKIRIFPNNTQAPSLLSVNFPDTVLVGEEYIISVNLTTPPSGLIDVHVNITLNNESIGPFPMSRSSGNEWRATLEHYTSGEITFQIGASDYSGLKISSEIYSITCLTPETSEETGPSEVSSDWIPFLIGSIGNF
jgi:predicted phosphodiesterase